MKNNIVIVGGIPEPIGGVTNFVYRLVTNYGSLITAVIDMYDSQNKVDLEDYKGGYHVVPNGVFRIFDLSKFLRKYKDNTIFFNFSRSYAFLLLMFLPKFDSSRWILMLHHGDLKITNKLIQLILSIAISKSRNKIDKVLALSEEQRIFYEDLHFKNIVNTTSYVPCTPPRSTFRYIQHVASNLRKLGKKIIVASGFPRKIYNHSWAIEFAEKNDTALFLFLYGDGDCMQDLCDSCLKVNNLYLFYGCSEPAFNFALSQADVYVRPNDVDSFGIACADAIMLGTPVLASNVCRRYTNCKTYEHIKGKNEFEHSLTDMLKVKAEVVSNNKLHNAIHNFKICDIM